MSRRARLGSFACAAAAALVALAVGSASAGPGLDVTITSGPEGKVASGDATFTFSANEPASFHCSLDGAALAPCRSPVSHRGLADGDHSFTVEAMNRDAAGTSYADTDTRRWTIDRSTPPPPPPPTGPPDYDGDGLTGGGDHCPSSPAGTQPVQDGCSAVELAGDPVPLGDPMRERLGLAFGWLGKRAKPLGKGLRRLRLGQAKLLRSLAELGEGAFCRGEKLAGRGLQDVIGGQRAIGSQLDSIQARWLRRFGPAEDADSQAGVAGLAVSHALLDRGSAEAAVLRELLRRLCEQVQGPLKVDGAIAEIDDARGLLKLADGRTFGLSDAASGRFFEGGLASLQGVAFKDGSGIVTKGTEGPGIDSNNQPVEAASGAQAKVKCVHFRIAPFQPFAPPLLSADEPYVLHHPRGYGDGTFKGRGASPLWLEDRMRIGAQFTCKSTGVQPANTYPVRSLRAEINYQGTLSNSAENFAIAEDLREGDTPAPLPGDIDPTKTATLSVRGEIRNCSLLVVQGQPPPCSPPTPLSEYEDYPVRVYDFGSYVKPQYDRTRFELDTKPAGSFQPAKITKLDKYLGAAGQSLTLDAQGWSYSGGSSSRPNLATIGLNQRFAVYLDDFFDPDGLFAIDIDGVDDPGALRWPRAKGKRNGHEFWYSVDLPQLIRDRVNECSGVDSYYRLPFGPIAGWSLGKGNFDDPDGGHAKGNGTGNDQRYAFDFSWDSGDEGSLGNNGAEIRAARPGEVWAMDEDETGNSVATTDEDGTKQSGPTPPGYGGVGNFTVIRHVDGTFGTYWHTKTNTTTVSVGSKVVRGQTIALGNNTGSSFSPHVHWDVRTGWHLQYPAEFIEFPSKLVKVQDQNHTCWRPRDADTMASNNGP